MNKGKKTQKLEQPVITEEDKQTTDPFLRALAKKIRNINKKITDIETLEKRGDLKPEQQDKINSKPSIIDQRKKYEEFVKFYKTTLAEANKDETANQLTPVLTKLSNALVTAHVLRTGGTLGNVEFAVNEKKILLNIGNFGEQENTFKNLTTNLVGYLGEYLDNQKLSAKVEEAYTNEDLLNTVVAATARQEAVVNTVKETPKKQHKTPKQNKVQQTKQVVQQVKQTVVTEPVITAPVQPTTQTTKQEPKVEDSWIDEPVASNPTPPVTQQNTQNATNQTQTKPEEEKKPQKNERYQKKPYDPNRSNYRQGGNRDGGYREVGNRDGGYREGGNRDGGYRDGGNREGGYKNYKAGERNYRPKYQEKQDQDDNRSDTSLEDSAEKDKRRTFNNRQINELQNDGFVVIQRKPKAKDTHESQEYSRKQHGYKDRRPHAN